MIAIDGPAGAGKSTTAKAIAQQLGLRYLDTGAMYRAMAWFARDAGLTDPAEIAAAFASVRLELTSDIPPRVRVGESDITDAIRTAAVSDAASQLSAHGAVRQELLRRQREMIAAGGVVLEGRDATTVIAPNADLKVYMTASLEERAQRRTREYAAKGTDADFSAVRADILQRDFRDTTRDESPLKVAPDAVIVETGGKSVEAVVDEIVALVNAMTDASSR
ncbi:MAG: (d)CMP kinase [Fimbriimonadaceae bacterium]|nr:(d)CMP kinase [Fimbriimonadaceae bacterium]